jgi:hypothetical protein
MTRQTWVEEEEGRDIKRILFLVEEMVRRLPPPPQYRPTTAIVMIVDPVHTIPAKTLPPR